MAKLWDKGFEINAEIEKYTVGRDRELDLYLAQDDVLGSMAHITMLESIGLLEKDELTALLAQLKEIYAQALQGDFEIEDGIEDVHSQVELMLTRSLGEMGKKIHSGRSRNDQVLVDLRLFTRRQLRLIVEDVCSLFKELQAQSERYKNVLMPGYTHLQVAMPSSFGLWFGAYAESLVDDMMMLQAAYRQTNRNPLGSAAGYGSSFPLNRSMTTRLLGFDSMDYNVVYARWDVARRSAMWLSPWLQWQVLLARWPLMPVCSTRRISPLSAYLRNVLLAVASCHIRRIPMSLS